MKENMRTKLWIYYGKAELQGGGIGMELRRIVDTSGVDEIFDIGHVFTRRRGLVIGGIYEIQTSDDDTSIISSSMKYLNRWPDEQLVAQLELQARAVEAAQRARRREKKESENLVLYGVLDPLRKIYQAATWHQRIAIEIQVLDFLRRGTIRTSRT